ncbi:putative erythromycin esterase [Zopfia rhizophila CBS 207.26]|uniref:Putative erythromycin esterase n=1 Tax=Zopfia rhizophila CBS 207.26 TaxID=1314779 RepID=A0A6A6DNW2_9PEZI|nr:putative erythromycin esterase [Zopfia rhizophila CBS 207.26]
MVQALSGVVKEACKPFADIDSKSFGSFFDSFAGSRVVLIGDASHGTSEFYRARAAITKRLIEQHGFSVVAIEGDWPDCRVIDNYVRQHPSAKGKTPMPVFKHFPEWMWRNQEVQDFVDWLRAYNTQLSLEKRAGFYGLDLYSMGSSIHAVIEYLNKVDPELAKDARRYGCLQPWINDPALYGRAAMHKGYAPCEAGVIKMLRTLLTKRIELSTHPENGENFFDAEMNARLIQDSERYYRSMYWGDSASWNIRDTHMFNTLTRVLKAKPGAKAVVWAHNSHLGDARATGMGQNRDELNLGQLCRENFTNPGEVSIISMGTHSGEVAASDAWDGPMRTMAINPSRADSYERIMHDTGIPSFFLDLRKGWQSEEVRKALEEEKLERFIGVVYHPKTERWSHYVKASLTRQVDAFVWFDKTSAVRAFEVQQPDEAIARGETYPFGL